MVRGLLWDCQPHEVVDFALMIKHPSRLVAGIVAILMLIPLGAFAFAIYPPSPRPLSVEAESPFTLTLRGSATDIQFFYVEVAPEYLYLANDPDTELFAFHDERVESDAPLTSFENRVPNEPLAYVLFAFSTTDPQLSFSLTDGDLFDVFLKAGNAPGVERVTFNVCAGTESCINERAFEQIFIDINVTPKSGSVPEPATIWLAFAALIAGGAVFRHGSKRS